MFRQGGPAPVPADGLAAALAPFGQSRMLPREAYVDPAVFEWEQHNIFSGWTCVGDASDLGAVGTQKAVGTGPNAILLVRADDGVVRSLATNWKVIADNYQECYHCSTIHPELSRISPPTSGENLALPGSWMGGWMSIVEGAETMSLTGKSGGVAIQGLSEHELRSVMYLVGYPNLLVSLHPDYVMTHLMTPLAVDRTHVECAWAFPKDVAASDDFDPSYAVDFWDLTNQQDWAACESVQRELN